MSAEGPPRPAARRGRPGRLQTKTGIALLHDEVSGHTYDVRLKLTEEVLTVQKQDVVCVSGSRPSTNVNGINVESATHEEVVHLLKNAGDEVTITVEYLREAPSFLKLPLGSPGPSSQPGSGASSPLFDSGLHLSGTSSNTVNEGRNAGTHTGAYHSAKTMNSLLLLSSCSVVSKSW